MRATLLLLVCTVLVADGLHSPVRFREHVIEPSIRGGYSVITADINHDGKPDVIGLTQQRPELAWYENPGWERHVFVTDMPAPVNMAAADIDGDGIPEVALETGFSMVAAKSEGLVWLLHHDGDPKGLWKATKIDAVTTSHHIAWADIDGDGKKELINAPLIGANALAPKYEDKVSLFYYRPGEWNRLLIDDQLYGILHRVRPVKWNDGRANNCSPPASMASFFIPRRDAATNSSGNTKSCHPDTRNPRHEKARAMSPWDRRTASASLLPLSHGMGMKWSSIRAMVRKAGTEK